MAGAIRIEPAGHNRLAEAESATQTSLADALSAAVSVSLREIMIAAMNADYEALRADPVAWAAEERERALWDTANLDGPDEC